MITHIVYCERPYTENWIMTYSLQLQQTAGAKMKHFTAAFKFSWACFICELRDTLPCDLMKRYYIVWIIVWKFHCLSCVNIQHRIRFRMLRSESLSCTTRRRNCLQLKLPWRTWKQRLTNWRKWSAIGLRTSRGCSWNCRVLSAFRSTPDLWHMQKCSCRRKPCTNGTIIRSALWKSTLGTCTTIKKW